MWPNSWRDIDLFIIYNTITNYILIIYKLSKFNHVFGVVSQTRVSGGNRTHNPNDKNLTHYSPDCQGTHKIYSENKKCNKNQFSHELHK